MEEVPNLESIKKLVKNDEFLGKIDDATLNKSLEKVNNFSPEDLEKYQLYQKRVLSMGVPACRILMTALLNNAKTTDEDIKLRFFETIDKLTNIEQFGGISIEYFDNNINKNTYCYIIMNKCTKFHNLSEQLEKIQPYLDEVQWDQILKQISMVLYLCKNIYKLTIGTCANQIFDLGFDINDVEELTVDPENTTLYIDEEWEERVGIYIMREADLEELKEELSEGEKEEISEGEKEELSESIKEELLENIKEDISEEIKEELSESIKESLKKNILEDIKDDI